MNGSAQSTSGSYRWVIGVDGGGTKTEAWLARINAAGELTIASTSLAGPSNLTTIEFSQVTEELKTVHKRLFEVISERPRPVDAICLAMSGAGNSAKVLQLEQWARSQRLANQSIVTHDARSLIAAGTTNDEGIALIAGTGSFAYARNLQGSEDRVGGWGPLLGDEGSGYWLATKAFNLACRSLDGRAAETLLVELFSQELGESDVRQWPQIAHFMTRAQIAHLAPLVCQAAQRHDKLAAELIDACLTEWETMVQTLLTRTFPNQQAELVLAGGLLSGDTWLVDQLQTRISQMNLPIKATTQMTSPVLGAVKMAVASLTTHP